MTYLQLHALQEIRGQHVCCRSTEGVEGGGVEGGLRDEITTICCGTLRRLGGDYFVCLNA